MTTSSTHASPVLLTSDRPTRDELVSLYESVGWTAYTRDPAQLERALHGSRHVVTARLTGRLVGLARVVGDGATIAYLQDVLVHPEHRRTGLGRRLVQAALEPYAHVRQQVLLTDSEPDQHLFYQGLGFTEVNGGPLRAFVRMGSS